MSMDIIEGNKLIAQFMDHDREYMEDTETYGSYHSDWSWLMPVVEKIESIGFQFFIHNEGSFMRKWFYKGNFPDFGNTGETKIESVWDTVIDFINWDNTQA